MGGAGTWSLAAAHPDRFAAAIPICGRGDPATAEKLKGLPIWAFHGEKDRPENSQVIVDAITKAGGKPKITIYPNAGHDVWTVTYNNPEVYTWLLEQKR
jgi:predicted peptidase